MAKCNKVLFNIDQSADTTAEEKATARNNIGAASADNIDADSVKVDGTDVKTKQSAKGNPDVSGGSATIFVDSITQNENGEITATRKSVRTASTSQTGVVQLTDSHTSTSTSTAATPKNVKEAYDLANSKADPASVVDSATYDSSSHTIVFKHGSTQLFTLDAAAFVKDGMVDSVAISNGNLVITFNTDAGKQPISIPLTDIFNPNNYYTKSATDVLLASKVDSTDSRLLPDADVFVATYTEQAAGTTMEELEAARTAGKKIYVNVGGAMSGSDNTYEKMIPLTYVRYYDGSVTGYFFETVIDCFVQSSDSGKITTYWRTANGWGHTTSEVKYAETAGTANEATNAGGYIEGGAIATNLAAKMNTNANNAAIGALQNLTGQLIAMPANTSLHDTTEIFSSYTFGFNTEGHVNEPYKLTLGHLWSIYIAQKTESVYARKPLIKVLNDPEYYQNGGAVNFVTVSSNGTNPSMPGNYQILCHRRNSPGWWGICQVPNGYDSNPYCEIDFDVSLTSYESDNTTPYAPMIAGKYPIPYIIEFCATFINASGNTPGGNIAYNDEHKFAVTTISAGVMLGDTQTFAHVRMEGYLQVAPDTNYAVLIGARGGNGQIGDGCNFHIKTNTVRVIMHPHKITIN